MTHPVPDHLIIDAAVAQLARRNERPARRLAAPEPGGDSSRTATALRRAARSSTLHVDAAERAVAERWRQIGRLARAGVRADDRTAAALTRGRTW